jgi:hypothetical protein
LYIFCSSIPQIYGFVGGNKCGVRREEGQAEAQVNGTDAVCGAFLGQLGRAALSRGDAHSLRKKHSVPRREGAGAGRGRGAPTAAASDAVPHVTVRAANLSKDGGFVLLLCVAALGNARRGWPPYGERQYRQVTSNKHTLRSKHALGNHDVSALGNHECLVTHMPFGWSIVVAQRVYEVRTAQPVPGGLNFAR